MKKIVFPALLLSVLAAQQARADEWRIYLRSVKAGTLSDCKASDLRLNNLVVTVDVCEKRKNPNRSECEVSDVRLFDEVRMRNNTWVQLFTEVADPHLSIPETELLDRQLLFTLYDTVLCQGKKNTQSFKLGSIRVEPVSGQKVSIPGKDGFGAEVKVLKYPS
ncbi:MAG: hypothetical protein V1495_00250 [Pseudomonadota bacterium]